MLENLTLSNVLFLDIETVPLHGDFDELTEYEQQLWTTKMRFQIKEDETAADVYDRAGIFAEFGKIVCISVGIIGASQDGKPTARIKSYASHDETELLENFADLLNRHYSGLQHLLCAHNGKEFDFPFIARRMLVKGVLLPACLDIAGKKPWEVRHLDTMELWKFGDFKHYTSLSLLTHLFEIPTPKDDISGADVGLVYWKENDLDRIVTYCQKDVLAIMQLLLKYKRLPLIEDEHIDLA